MGSKSLVLLLNKTTLKRLFSLKKIVFYIFEPQNRKVIDNYFKVSLNFRRLKGKYLGKLYFNIIIIGASEKLN